MSNPLLDAKGWYSALSLKERADALLSSQAGISTGETVERANQRLQQWRLQFPFLCGDDLFHALASTHDIDADLLIRLLGESVGPSLRPEQESPEWFSELNSATYSPM